MFPLGYWMERVRVLTERVLGLGLWARLDLRD